MAVVYWSGDVDSDWQDNGNWDGNIPVTNDEVIFDSRSTVDVDDGMAVGETGGVDYDLLHIKKGHTANIGTSSERLHTSADKIIIEGSGTYYIEVSENATGQDQTIPLVVVNNKDCTVYLTSNQNDGSWCCEFTEVLVLAGTVYIGDSNVDTAVQYLRIFPRFSKSAYAAVTVHEDCIRSKGTAYDMTVILANGTCTMDSAALLIEQYGGTFTYGSDLGGSPETVMVIDLLRLHKGTFNWQPDDSGDNAVITATHIYGGALIASGVTNNDRTKILAAVTLYEGGTLNVANNKGNVIVSNLKNFGGTFIFDNNAKAGLTYDLP